MHPSSILRFCRVYLVPIVEFAVEFASIELPPSSIAMASFLDNSNDHYNYDHDYPNYLEENGVCFNHALSDCFLTADELEEIMSPSAEIWRDLSPFENGTLLTMDSAKREQWKSGQEEIKSIRTNVKKLIFPSDDEVPLDRVTDEKIFNFNLGSESKVGTFLQQELNLDEDNYNRFMGTLCLQAAYHQMTKQLYGPLSELKDRVLMEKDEYISVWKLMAEKKKLNITQISTSRRDTPLWEEFEVIVNTLFRAISVTGREGKISIALDDDKIWMNTSKGSSADLFNLKYCQHVQANRKGLVAHSAFTTAVIHPLGIAMERTKDKTCTCFKRILDFLFSHDGTTNLRNVIVHSDRGYMIPQLVFEYLMASGANVLGTVKRITNCWPYTYNQKLSVNDKRTVIDCKGAPALFLKWCKFGAKYIFASAFRNGSESVATAISTIHSCFQWEGVALKIAELLEYEKDDKSLIPLFFRRVADLDGVAKEECQLETEEMNNLMEKIEPYTLRQGE